MPSNWLFWVLFNLFVLALLALDLGVFHRSKHVVGFREAIGWTLVWISLAAGFAVLIYFFGHTMVGGRARPNSELSLEFIAGYLIEQSLSVDNLFCSSSAISAYRGTFSTTCCSGASWARWSCVPSSLSRASRC